MNKTEDLIDDVVKEQIISENKNIVISDSEIANHAKLLITVICNIKIRK